MSIKWTCTTEKYGGVDLHYVRDQFEEVACHRFSKLAAVKAALVEAARRKLPVIIVEADERGAT